MREAHAIDPQLVLVPVHGDVERVLADGERVLEGHAEELPFKYGQSVLDNLFLSREDGVQKLDAVDVSVQI